MVKEFNTDYHLLNNYAYPIYTKVYTNYTIAFVFYNDVSVIYSRACTNRTIAYAFYNYRYANYTIDYKIYSRAYTNRTISYVFYNYRCANYTIEYKIYTKACAIYNYAYSMLINASNLMF